MGNFNWNINPGSIGRFGIGTSNKFSVNQIIANVSKNPLLHPNKYEVIITGPIEISKEILFNCYRCSVPGHSIGSFEHSNIGPKRKIPNEELYEDISTSFYNSDSIKEIKLIDEWLKMISGDGGMHSVNSYRMAYYNDIVSEMTINIYNTKESLTSTVKVYEAYPVGMSETELSYAGEMPSDVTINWAYHSFEIFEVQDANTDDSITVHGIPLGLPAMPNIGLP